MTRCAACVWSTELHPPQHMPTPLQLHTSQLDARRFEKRSLALERMCSQLFYALLRAVKETFMQSVGAQEGKGVC